LWYVSQHDPLVLNELVHFGWICILNPLIHKQLIWLLLFHDEVLSRDDSKHLLIRRNLHGDDLVGLTLFVALLQKFHLDLAVLDFLESVNVIEMYLVDFRNQKCIHAFDWEATGAIHVFLNHIDPEVMLELSPVDIKRLLVGLVSDAVLHSFAEHHLRAVHEVKHHIFKRWLKSCLVNFVKVDGCISGDLNPRVAFDVEDESSLVDRVVPLPLTIASEFVKHQFEEKNLRAAPDHEGLVVD
jgi:hypothetical protein